MCAPKMEVRSSIHYQRVAPGNFRAIIQLSDRAILSEILTNACEIRIEYAVERRMISCR